MDTTALDEIRRLRDEATKAVAESDHPLRLIVSGPGTGKTYTFKEALKLATAGTGRKGLCLTFIRKLTADLEEELKDYAQTYTFHKFAKMLVYRLRVPGFTLDFSLYPPLGALIDQDIGLLDPPAPELKEVERLMQELEASRFPPLALSIGTYYDAASFVDVVYRVFLYLQDHPEETPDYPLVVVDEYQDFTRLETAFIAQLGFKSKLLVAGDDDQALYERRFASAEFIRALRDSSESEEHELPYCSRCTEPVVDAVNAVIEAAVAAGHLERRIDKPYRCFLPDKLEASSRYPKITTARVTTWDVLPRYVEGEIAKIPPEDVEASKAGRWPTALIVGPRHFVSAVYEHLKNGPCPQAEFPHSEQPEIEPIDGYRRIGRDATSNLGWRILVSLRPFPGWEDAVRDSIEAREPLVDRLPDDYRAAHQAIGDLVQLSREGHSITDEERARLVEALGVTDADLDETLAAPDDSDNAEQDDDEESADTYDEEGSADDSLEPTILCTTLMGAKGLSAEHVFVVGAMRGHFPARDDDPTDTEIRQFLVALSRARTACQVVWCKRLGRPAEGQRRWPEVPDCCFVRWIANQSRRIEIAASDVPAARRKPRAAS